MTQELAKTQTFVGKKTVSRTVGKDADGKTIDVSTPLEVQVFEPGAVVAHVRVSNGATINLGNYESLRVDISVEIPCYKEEAPGAIMAASHLIDAYLEDEIEKTRKIIKGGR